MAEWYFSRYVLGARKNVIVFTVSMNEIFSSSRHLQNAFLRTNLMYDLIDSQLNLKTFLFSTFSSD